MFLAGARAIHRTQFTSPDSSQLDMALRDWFDTAPGRLLIEQERAALRELSANVFGYHLVQLGMLDGDFGHLSDCPVQNKTVVTSVPLPDRDGITSVRADCAQLPICSDSIDTVVLAHTLDFVASPHQVLREAERILIPEGRLLIVGFNPFSVWGLWRLALRRRGRVPWCGKFVPYTHLQDWLSLLGFDIEVTLVRMFRPPLQRAGLLERMQFLERAGNRFWPMLAGIYLIKAIKRTACVTPLGSRWRVGPIGTGVAEPTTRAAGGG